jgi:hypothetical protein
MKTLKEMDWKLKVIEEEVTYLNLDIKNKLDSITKKENNLKK